MSFTLNNCTLDSKFAQAVRQGLTVRQAMDQGFLNSEAFFGYSAFRGRGQEEQPLVSEGYGYDNMKRLRLYRIIPIGWELRGRKDTTDWPDTNTQTGRGSV